MKFGLTEHTLQLIINCISNFTAIDSAVLYGSRAKGNFKDGSDIDISLKGKNLTLKDVLKLENEIDDLLLPYKFDISIYQQINNQDLIEHIDRLGIEIYNKKEN
jgi:predicted nucleotidyltransferase